MSGIFYIGGFHPPSSHHRKKEPRFVDADPNDNSSIDKPPLIDKPDYDNLPQLLVDGIENGRVQKIDVMRQNSSVMIDFIARCKMDTHKGRLFIVELGFTDMVGDYHSESIEPLEKILAEKISKFTGTRAIRIGKSLYGFEYTFCSDNLDKINMSCSADSNRFFDIALSTPGHPMRLTEQEFRNMTGYIIHSMVNSRPGKSRGW
jgi:hypothetical protein